MKQRPSLIEVLISIIAPTLCMFVAGCSLVGPNLEQHDAAMSEPLSPELARVCFVRQSSMMGAIVSHYVFDAGTNITFDSTLIETSQWVPARDYMAPRKENLLAWDAKLGKRILDGITGTNVSRPTCFMVASTQNAVSANSDIMDSAYVVLAKDVLPDRALKRIPSFTGKNYLWAMSADSQRPRVFIRLPERGVKWENDRFLDFIVVSGPNAVKYMAEEIGRNVRYLGAVRSGGITVFDRPQGSMRLKVVTPSGEEAFAADFAVEKGKKYTVVYSYGFAGVKFTISERP